MTSPADPRSPAPDAHLLALVADRTHSAVVIADATGHTQWVNAGFTRLTGYQLPEVVGYRPGALLQGPDTDPGTVAFMRDRIRAGEGFRTEVLNYRKDRTTYWLDVEIQPVRNGAGALTHFIAIEQDITERKRAEAALARTLALQTGILESTIACVISVDTVGTVVTFNRAAEREFGYAAGEVIGRDTPVPWHVADEVAARARTLTVELGRPVAVGFEALVARAAEGQPDTNQWTFVRKDGSRFPGELTITALCDGAGRVAGYLGLVTNISRRLDGERALRELANELAERNAELEEKSRLAALQAEIALGLNRDTPLPELLRGCCAAILRVTECAFVRAWTLNAAEHVLELQASVGLYTHTDGAHARVPVGAFKIGRIAETRTPHLTNDVRSDPLVNRDWAAREGLVGFAGHPLLCEGQVVGVLALFARTPLSAAVSAALRVAADALAMGIARRRAETALREQQGRHRAVVESALDCIITIDRHGRVTDFNPAAERTFAYARDEALGRELVQLIVSPENRDGRPDGLAQYLRGDESDVLGTRLPGLFALRKDGTRTPLELAIVPTRVGGETVFTTFCRDVTAEHAAEAKRREAELQLQKAKEAAEHATRSQNQFLANVSHELRTPVTAIVGYAEMLLDPRLGADDRVRAAKTIIRSGRHLMSLINDVLDFGKIEAGRMEVERTACRLRRLVLGAIDQADVGAREKNLDLRLTPTGRLPATLTTDPTRLRQILDNLLSNAIKFTEPGGRVELRLRLDAPGAGTGRLLFEVEDEGIGISADALPRLFQPFTQADASTTRRFGGTGLGLSICRRLAHLLGGDITVRSAPGAGSCFTLALPIPPDDLTDLLDEHDFSEASQSVLRAGPAPPKLAGRVLLAEDTPTLQTILRYFLERAGLTVEVVDNGRAAVDRALAAEFDVILMDMQMPVLDGYAAATALRQNGYARSIVALTAHAMTGDEEKCLRAGCNVYLTKPVDQHRLLRVIARQVPSRSGALNVSAVQRIVPAAAPAPGRVPPAADSPPLDKLTADYRRALPDKVRAIGAALRDRNITHLSDLAHRLRGSAGMYGLPTVSESAGRLEDACRAGSTVPQLSQLIDALTAECQRTAPAGA